MATLLQRAGLTHAMFCPNDALTPFTLARADPDNPLRSRLQATGVVYNELLGYASSPSDAWSHGVCATALAGTPHAYNFGGEPSALLRKLRPEHVRAFHAAHYRPTNLLFVAYAAAALVPLDRTLALLDSYLSRCAAVDAGAGPLQPRPPDGSRAVAPAHAVAETTASLASRPARASGERRQRGSVASRAPVPVAHATAATPASTVPRTANSIFRCEAAKMLSGLPVLRFPVPLSDGADADSVGEAEPTATAASTDGQGLYYARVYRVDIDRVFERAAAASASRLENATTPLHSGKDGATSEVDLAYREFKLRLACDLLTSGITPLYTHLISAPSATPVAAATDATTQPSHTTGPDASSATGLCKGFVPGIGLDTSGPVPLLTIGGMGVQAGSEDAVDRAIERALAISVGRVSDSPPGGTTAPYCDPYDPRRVAAALHQLEVSLRIPSTSTGSNVMQAVADRFTRLTDDAHADALACGRRAATACDDSGAAAAPQDAAVASDFKLSLPAALLAPLQFRRHAARLRTELGVPAIREDNLAAESCSASDQTGEGGAAAGGCSSLRLDTSQLRALVAAATLDNGSELLRLVGYPASDGEQANTDAEREYLTTARSQWPPRKRLAWARRQAREAEATSEASQCPDDAGVSTPACSGTAAGPSVVVASPDVLPALTLSDVAAPPAQTVTVHEGAVHSPAAPVAFTRAQTGAAMTTTEQGACTLLRCAGSCNGTVTARIFLPLPLAASVYSSQLATVSNSWLPLASLLASYGTQRLDPREWDLATRAAFARLEVSTIVASGCSRHFATPELAPADVRHGGLLIEAAWLKEHAPAALRLLHELLTDGAVLHGSLHGRDRSLFGDYLRAAAHDARQNLADNAGTYVAALAPARVNAASAARSATSGLPAARRLLELHERGAAGLQHGSTAIAASLRTVLAHAAQNRDCLPRLMVTADADAVDAAADDLLRVFGSVRDMWASVGGANGAAHEWSESPEPLRALAGNTLLDVPACQGFHVGLALPAPVWGTRPHVHARLLCELLAEGPLHASIREAGGAYGVDVDVDPCDALVFTTADDPQPMRSLAAFGEALRSAAAGDFMGTRSGRGTRARAERALAGGKMALLGDMDEPTAATEVGFTQLVYGITRKQRLANRQEVLDAGVEDVAAVAAALLPALDDALAAGAVVAGPAGKLAEELRGKPWAVVEPFASG